RNESAALGEYDMSPPASTSLRSPNIVGRCCFVANSTMIGRYAVVMGEANVMTASGRFRFIAENAAGKSLGSLTSNGCRATFKMPAAAWVSCHSSVAPSLEGFQSTASRASLGNASFSTARRLLAISTGSNVVPVMIDAIGDHDGDRPSCLPGGVDGS